MSEELGRIVDAPVVEVTLLEDRAHVVRQGQARVGVGPVELAIEGVTPAVADKTVTATLVSAPEGTQLVGTTVQRRTIYKRTDRPQEVRRVQAEWEDKRDEIERLRSRRDLLERHLAELGRLAETTATEIVEDAAWNRGEPESWRRALDQLAEREQAVRVELQDVRDAQAKAEETLGHLDTRRELLDTPASHEVTSLVVTLLTEAEGDIDLRVDYIVPGACWRPYHAVELLDGGRVRWRCDACVWQNTGEDWTEASLRMSTERPSLGADPPELTDDLLSVQRRQERVVVETREQEIQTTGLGASVRTEPELPGIDDGGDVVELRSASPTTVRSDGQPHRVGLFAFETECRSSRVVMAELRAAVILKSTQKNASAFPLLAGPVDLIRNGGLAGRTSILFIAPGEEFELGWGPDSALRVQRDHERLKDESRMLSSWTTQRHRITLTLSNLGDATRNVRISERIPVSEVEKVRISLVKSPGDVQPDENGFMSWTVRLGPLGRDKQRLEYEIQKHDDVVGLA